MMIFQHDTTEPWSPPSGTLRARLTPGALRLVEEGGARWQYYAGATVEEIEVAGLLSAEAGISLATLDVAELQEIVKWADVETSAGTASGLRRAIERHFEEG